MGIYSYPINRQQKIRNRRRNRQSALIKRIAAGLVVIVLLVVVGSALAHRTFHVDKELSLVYEPIVVTSGDTLWNLAEKTGINQDKRMLVSTIMNYNALASSTIYPGQVIYIPVSTSHSRLLTP